MSVRPAPLTGTSQLNATPVPTTAAPTATAPSSPNPLISFVRTDNNLEITIDAGLYPGHEHEIDRALRDAFEIVKKRIHYTPHSGFTAALTLDSSCNLKGISHPNRARVQVFTCNTIPYTSAIAIMAHEYVHRLIDDRFGGKPIRTDLMLVEGLATYGAGGYWLNGYKDFRSYVHAMHARGIDPPLTKDPLLDGTDSMNDTYYQWASFVEFLIEQDPSLEKIYRLYPTGTGVPGSAQYKDAFHKSRADLEIEWRKWIDSAPGS